MEASIVLVRERKAARRPKFRQRRIVAFTASCCYAKIAPAALHCGDFSAGASKRREGARIGFTGVGRGRRDLSVRTVHVPDGMGFKQNLPVV
jgi:hypothetical protein